MLWLCGSVAPPLRRDGYRGEDWRPLAENRMPQDLPDDLRLTQFGDRSKFGQGFRDRLRVGIGETEISLILGEVDASAASRLVLKYLIPLAASLVTTVGA